MVLSEADGGEGKGSGFSESNEIVEIGVFLREGMRWRLG